MKTMNVIFSILVGILAGLCMGVLLILMGLQFAFSINNLSFLLVLLVGGLLPVCIRPFSRFKIISMNVCKVVMIVASFCILVGYGFYLQANTSLIHEQNTILQTVMLYAGVIHIFSFVVMLLEHLLRKKRG